MPITWLQQSVHEERGGGDYFHELARQAATRRMQSPTKENNNIVNHPRSKSRMHNAQPSPTKDGNRSFKTQGMLFGDLCPVEYNKKLDPPAKACFNCWSFQHQRKCCTQPKTYDYCCNCGRKALTVVECPRCARAFHALASRKKDWIYRNFFDIDSYQEQITPEKRNQDDECWVDYYKWKQMSEKRENQEDEYQDDYDGNNRQSPSGDSHVKNASDRSKMMELKDEDFVWEPLKSYYSLETAYAEPYVLFDFMQHKKIIDVCENEKMEKVVNLDDTRMAEMDSLDDGKSIVSIEDFPKKVKGLSRLSGDPLQDFLCLLDAVKHLSVTTQDVIVMQYMDERKELLAAKNYASLLKSQ